MGSSEERLFGANVNYGQKQISGNQLDFFYILLKARVSLTKAKEKKDFGLLMNQQNVIYLLKKGRSRWHNSSMNFQTATTVLHQGSLLMCVCSIREGGTYAC